MFATKIDRPVGGERTAAISGLTVKQTATGYWGVESGVVHLAGALTREAAEAERDMLEGLHDRILRRRLLQRHGRRQQRS